MVTGYEVLPYYQVTIAGADMMSVAWTLLNPQELLQAAEQVGENINLPGIDGRLGRNTTADQQTVDLQFLFNGYVSVFGVPYEDPVAGLALNKRGFRENVFKAERDDEGAVALSIEDGDGTVFEGPVQLRKLRFGEGLHECTAVLTVVVLRGELVEATGS